MARRIERGDVYLHRFACAANLDHVQTVRKDDLRHYVTTLGPEPMRRLCEALAIATACG